MEISDKTLNQQTYSIKHKNSGKNKSKQKNLMWNKHSYTYLYTYWLGDNIPKWKKKRIKQSRIETRYYSKYDAKLLDNNK